MEILYLILFGHIKTDFVRYLIGSASRVNWDKLTVGETVQDIESVGQRDWFTCDQGRVKNGRRTLKVFWEDWYAQEISRFVCNKVRLFEVGRLWEL